MKGLRWLSHPWVRKGLTIALTLVAVVSMVLLLRANWDTLRSFDWQMRPVPLALSFLAYSLALALAILGWGWIMTALGSTIQWAEHIRVYCISNLARRLPGVLWYVVGRVVLYDREKASKAAISVGSALELILTALSGLLVGALVWPGLVREVFAPWWVAAGAVLGLVAIHPRVLRVPLRRLGHDLAGDLEGGLRYRQVLGWLLLYAAVWVAGGLVLFGLIQTLYPVPFKFLPQTIGAWSLSGMVAVAAAVLPVGFGFRELALGLLLSNFLPEGVALVVAILARLLLTLYELVWLLIVHALKGKPTPLTQR